MVTNRHGIDQYLNIVLAIATTLVLFVGLLFNILALIYGDDFLRHPPHAEVMQAWIGIVGMVVVLCVFWFWFRMLNDYFRNRPEKHSVAWGWALFMLSFGAALPYFWFIWRPRNTRMRPTDA